MNGFGFGGGTRQRKKSSERMNLSFVAVFEEV
jgi:hypothetical protein